MPDTPLRGADAVHDGELEVGYNAGFEGSWRRVEQVGRVVLGLIVVAGAAGLFGRGPFSHRQATTASGALAADWEPVARYGTPTMVTIHLDTRRFDPAHQWVVHVNNVFVEPMGLQAILPQPAHQAVDGAGLAVTVGLDGARQDGLLRFMLKPTEVGRMHMEVHVGQETIDWHQVVLP